MPGVGIESKDLLPLLVIKDSIMERRLLQEIIGDPSWIGLATEQAFIMLAEKTKGLRSQVHEFKELSVSITKV